MGNITLEQIDLIMARANVSYNEAKEALEQCNGDPVEALLFLEKADKLKTNSKCCHSNNGPKCEGVKSFFKKLHETTFTLTKGERTYLNLPLSITLIGAIICCPFSLLALVIALVYGMKIKITGNNDVAEKINSTFTNLQK